MDITFAVHQLDQTLKRGEHKYTLLILWSFTKDQEMKIDKTNLDSTSRLSRVQLESSGNELLNLTFSHTRKIDGTDNMCNSFFETNPVRNPS